MARPTKELTERRDELIKKHKDIFEVLKNCGGGLYEKDLANLLECPQSTLSDRLKKCVEAKLIKIDKVTHFKTQKNLVRLTKVGWGKNGVNTSMCSYQVDTIDFFFYRAIYQKYFNEKIVEGFGTLDLKEEFIQKVTNLEEYTYNNNSEKIDKDDYRRNVKCIKDNISILNKTNLLIKDLYLSQEMIRVKIHYINRKIDPKTLVEVMDLLTGVLEKYAFITNQDYYQVVNYIKIELEIITESAVDKIELCNYIKAHKRNYYTYTKEKQCKPTMYNTFKYVFKNHIEFRYIDKENLNIVSY